MEITLSWISYIAEIWKIYQISAMYLIQDKVISIQEDVTDIKYGSELRDITKFFYAMKDALDKVDWLKGFTSEMTR